MAVKIIPTVLARTREEFDQRLQKLLPVADELQIDFEDGRFVPSTGVGMHEIPDLTKYGGKIFEAHLMVQTPGAFIQPAAARGFKRVIFHVEVIDEMIMEGLLEQCRKYQVVPVLATNPETPVDRLLPYVDKVDCVLFLGVHPGFNGAPYVPETTQRIAEFIRKSPKRVLVQVDGGMTPETIGAAVAAGADRINSGSFISNAPDPKAAIDALIKAAEAATPTQQKPVAALSSAKPIPRESVKGTTRKPVSKSTDSKKTNMSARKSTKSSPNKPTRTSMRKAAKPKRKSSKSPRSRSARPASRSRSAKQRAARRRR